MKNNKKAIVLLSGGLDSATALYFARDKGFDCSCLIFDYGQRHRREIESARAIAQGADCEWRVIKVDLPWKGSALLDKAMKIPSSVSRRPSPSGRLRSAPLSSVPSTYVPARNIIFLSSALSWAEAAAARAIFIGAHAQDYSGYPDCRPEFFRAFREAAKCGTKAGAIDIHTPLIDKNKAEIIKLAGRLRVPLELTWSCYRGGRRPCGACDSCYYRAKGFREAGLKDPVYR